MSSWPQNAHLPQWSAVGDSEFHENSATAKVRRAVFFRCTNYQVMVSPSGKGLFSYRERRSPSNQAKTFGNRDYVASLWVLATLKLSAFRSE